MDDSGGRLRGELAADAQRGHLPDVGHGAVPTAVPVDGIWRVPADDPARWLVWWDRPSRHLLLAVVLVALAAVASLLPRTAQAQLVEVHDWRPGPEAGTWVVEEYRRVDYACDGENASRTACATPGWQVRPDQVSGVRLSVSDDGTTWTPVPRRERTPGAAPPPPGLVLFEPVDRRLARFEFVHRTSRVPGVSSSFSVPARAAAQGVRLEVRWPADLPLTFRDEPGGLALAESAPGRRVYALPPQAPGDGRTARVAYVAERTPQQWASIARRYQPAPSRPLDDLSRWILSQRLPADAPPADRARAIYEWIGANVVPTADRRWWRHGLDAVTPVEQVLADGHGDSRAIANLTAHLMRGAGVDADVVEVCPETVDTRLLVPADFQRTAGYLPRLDTYVDAARAGEVAFGRIAGAGERITVFNTRTAEAAWVTQPVPRLHGDSGGAGPRSTP